MVRAPAMATFRIIMSLPVSPLLCLPLSAAVVVTTVVSFGYVYQC